METYSYDSQNRLIGWTDGVSAISYAHDALDRRIAVTLDGVTESFVYDPWSPYSAIANDVLLDFEDGALVRRWLHGPEVDEPLAYERYAGTTAGGTGTALELFRNRLGSVILAVSVSTGAVAAEYDYDSFGQRTLVQGTEEVRYGFTSREHDALTGLIHYRARAYDPLTGRFLQRDPIGFASGDLNLYAYVENDPYNFTDPSGLSALSSFTNVARQSAQATRSAVGTIGGGVLNLARNIANGLSSSRTVATVAAVDRAVSCGSAVANAATGNYGGAAADGAGCVAGGVIDRVIGDAINGVRTGVRRLRGTCSFDEATLVLTDAGYVPISEVGVEDLVLSRDELSGETAYQRVLDVYANHYDVTVTLTIADLETAATQEIVSNEIHPFFAVPSEARVIPASSEGHLYRGAIPGGAWIDAVGLRPGDLLLQDDGEWSEVVSVVATDAPLQAFNLSVAEFHTYFVAGELGEDAVWVHNN